MSDNPYTSPENLSYSPSEKASLGLAYGDVAPLCSAAGWLKFLGILNIIIGIVYCITIIGAIIGWLPLWIGVSLNSAANSLRAGYERQNSHEIRAGMTSTALVFKIVGVIVVIYLALMALYFLFVIGFMILAGVSHMQA